MYTHTLVTVQILVMFKSQPSRQTCIYTLVTVQMLKSCLKISHLAKRVYTHTTYSANVEVMFKNQPSRQTCIHAH